MIANVEPADVPALLAAHDVLVLPSWSGGMSHLLLEWAAAGMPCVVGAAGGNLDVFRPDDPQRGGSIMIAPTDPEGLYGALAILVEEDELWSKLAERARSRAQEFTSAKSADQA